MSSAYINIPGRGAASWKASVADVASLPASNNTSGDARVVRDSGDIYVWVGSAWEQIGAGGGMITIGTFGSSPNDDGLLLSSDILTLEPADATHPGALSLGDQSFPSGKKTFSNSITPITSAPTNPVIVQDSSSGGNYYDNGTIINYHAFSYKVINGVHIYSTTSLNAGTVTITNSIAQGGTDGNATISWDADPNADGYKVFKAVQYPGDPSPYPYIPIYEGPGLSFIDDSGGGPPSPPYAPYPATPTSYEFSAEIGKLDLPNVYGLYTPDNDIAAKNIYLPLDGKLFYGGNEFPFNVINYPGTPDPFVNGNADIFWPSGSPFLSHYGYIGYPDGSTWIDSSNNMYLNGFLFGPAGSWNITGGGDASFATVTTSADVSVGGTLSTPGNTWSITNAGVGSFGLGAQFGGYSVGSTTVGILANGTDDPFEVRDLSNNSLFIVYADGSVNATNVVKTAPSKLAFFGQDPVVEQSGDVAAAQALYGQMTAPFYAQTVVTKTTTYTITGADDIVNCNGTFTVTLPSAGSSFSGGKSRVFTVANIGAGVITMSGITKTLAAGVAYSFYTDGTTWFAK